MLRLWFQPTHLSGDAGAVRNKQCQRLLFALSVVVVLGAAVPVWSQTTDGEILQRISEMDRRQRFALSDKLQPSGGGFETQFTMEQKHPQPYDPTAGGQLDTVQSAWTENWCVLKIMRAYEHPPISPKLPQSASNQTRLFSRVEEIYVASTKELNETLQVEMVYVIGPTGEVVSKKSNQAITRYRIGDPENLHVFEQFRRATGWGFSGMIEKVINMRTIEIVTKKFVIEAKAAHPYQGKWVLTLNQADELVVREAKYLPPKSEKPTIETGSSGLLNCPGLRLAESGFYKMGSYEVQFHVLKLESFDGNQARTYPLLREVLEKIKNSNPTRIMEIHGDDIRLITPDQKPQTTTAPAASEIP